MRVYSIVLLVYKTYAIIANIREKSNAKTPKHQASGGESYTVPVGWKVERSPAKPV